MSTFTNFIVLFLTCCWCQVAIARGDFDIVPDQMIGSLESESDEFDLENGDDPESVGHFLKRETEPEYFTPEYCKKIGYCGLEPSLSLICLVKCNFDQVDLLKPYLGLVPELPMFMCQTVNTIFPRIPKQMRIADSKISNVRAYLRLLDVESDDEIDFAKASANALPVTMIKKIEGPIFDDLKPAVKKLEIHDVDKRTRSRRLKFQGSKILGSLLSLISTDQKFVNPKCDKTNLDDETLMLISAMKTRKCNMDILMPGYFAFNMAPKMAATREILPLVRAWNMPLLMFTGVKCCMVQYAINKIRSKCSHKYDILDKPHGLPTSTGPESVCDAIPTLFPLHPITTESSLQGHHETSSTDIYGETTTESPCNDANKSDLEECAEESASVVYSEEMMEILNKNFTQPNEEIESDEYTY